MKWYNINKYITSLVIPTFDKFYTECTEYFFNGHEDSLIYLVTEVNKILNTDYDTEEMIDDKDLLKQFYNDIMMYIDKSPFEYVVK